MRRMEVHAIAEGARIRPMHIVIVLTCTLMFVAEGYDLGIVAAALPSVMREMKIAPTLAGVVLSLGYFGMMVGAIVVGMLADRVGRRRIMAACLGAFSVGTAVTGLVHDVVLLSAVRFAAGMAIGGVIPCVVAHVTEFSPRRSRTTMVAIAFSGFSIGGMLAAFLSSRIIEVHGWRPIFYIAVLPVLVVPIVTRLLPESIGYLVKKGRVEELLVIACRLDPGWEERPDNLVVIAPSDEQGADRDVSVAQLFGDGRWSSTVMFWITCIMCVSILYGLGSWLAKMLTNSGYSLSVALNTLLALNIGALVGGIGVGLLADRFQIKMTVCLCYLVAAVVIVELGSDVPAALLYVMAGILGASTYGGNALTFAYAGQFYPSCIRSSGVGWVTGMGRFGAILAPVALGGLMTLQLTRQENFLVIAIPMVIAAAAVSLIGVSVESRQVVPE